MFVIITFNYNNYTDFLQPKVLLKIYLKQQGTR